MILVDTSVWIGHFRKADPHLVQLLQPASAATHPFVIGEIARRRRSSSFSGKPLNG